ncbi:hypothetical protein D4Q52_18695 [Rhodopseudomonas palustris]|uniref:Uncharacterized protein n=1 Tax=Rhodopseudomonas palustris TaxID=1076 RepID=A0A418V225_RHOPL|nr:hypothetical protein D4Q52_18695 [Rhodopseudomonas palustris]
MAGLVPAIHAFSCVGRKAWMPGTSPGMTGRGLCFVASAACRRALSSPAPRIRSAPRSPRRASPAGSNGRLRG